MNDFLMNLPGSNRFLIIMAFLLLILFFTYRNMYKRAKGEEELKEKLDSLSETVKEKNNRIQEIHHRSKNNLQILTFMLERSAGKFDDEAWKKEMNKFKTRINSIATINNLLNDCVEEEYLDVGPYLERLVHKTSQLLTSTAQGVDVNADIESMVMDQETATVCGIVLNELITNCFQHAYHETDRGRVDVQLERNNGDVKMSVADNGTGVQESAMEDAADSFGNSVIASLVNSNLQGEIEYLDMEEGTNVRITFPAPEETKKSRTDNDK